MRRILVFLVIICTIKEIDTVFLFNNVCLIKQSKMCEENHSNQMNLCQLFTIHVNRKCLIRNKKMKNELSEKWKRFIEIEILNEKIDSWEGKKKYADNTETINPRIWLRFAGNVDDVMSHLSVFFDESD